MNTLEVDNEAFVTAAYQLLLGRAPDEAGRTAMLAALGGNTPYVGCLAEMAQSPEFSQRVAQLRASALLPKAAKLP